MTTTDYSSVYVPHLCADNPAVGLGATSSAVIKTPHRDPGPSFHVTPLDSCCTPRATNEPKHIAACDSDGGDWEKNSLTGILNIKELKIHDDNSSAERSGKAVYFDGADVTDVGSPEKKSITATVRFETTLSRTDSKSKSELASAQRIKSDNNLFQKLFSRSSRGRTVMPSGRRSKFSNLLVQSGKGRSSLHHRITVEALTHLSAHSTTDGKESYNGEEISGYNQAFDDECKEHSIPGSVHAVRADSEKKNRRGRSLFRTGNHKRSRARSPSKDSSGERIRFRSVRRESPSPEPGKRKHWPRKLLTRAEREKKRDERDQKETGK